MENKPLLPTFCHFRTYRAPLWIALLLIALVPAENGSAARNATSAADPAQHVRSGQPDVPVSASSHSVVIERLSKLKTKQELIEKNKRFPMLHEDATKFLGSVEVVATGYYAGVESTGKRPGHPEYGITYSGVKVRHGVLSTIAADPKVFPLGTILYIPGYGYGIVADTGSAIKGKKIDLYYETKDQIYKEWGKRTVNVFIVKKGNGKVTEQTLNMWDDVLSAISEGQIGALEL
ncbi:3D domain-containing protein [Paenibacillus sp. GYB003]|uniref:3D domain-containing protein n=1 Tax=Paenibacillus sp. GYB003 TaxID=2994392 RepID=UPI002F96DD66